jgi:hypothetical protein
LVIFAIQQSEEYVASSYIAAHLPSKALVAGYTELWDGDESYTAPAADDVSRTVGSGFAVATPKAVADINPAAQSAPMRVKKRKIFDFVCVCVAFI